MKILVQFDKYLFAVLCVVLGIHYTGIMPSIVGDTVLLIVSCIATIPVLVSAFQSLKNKKISVDLLASIALVVSLVAHEWASSVFINLMLTSARIFGYYTESRARAAIQSLMKLRPEMVKVRRGNEIISLHISEVVVGDYVVVESGERVAVDGIVEEGEASIDQSSLTGESIPVNKTKGDSVFSSTLNVSGSLVVHTTKVGKDTAFEKLIELVENSQNEKSKVRMVADAFVSWYIGLTLIAAIALYVAFHDPKILLSLLLVACADDIAIAIPMGYLAAIGYAAKRGVIIKGSAYLDELSRIRTIIFDKTGTITRGVLAVKEVIPVNSFSPSDLLSLAGSIENISDHPIAKSIVKYVRAEKVEIGKIENFKEYTGKGIIGEKNGKKIIAGNSAFFENQNLQISLDQKAQIESCENNGCTVTLIAQDGVLVGIIGSADEVRPHAKSTIQKLKEYSITHVVMLTGDNERVAKKISGEVGITEFHSSLLPEDKQKFIKSEIGKSGSVMMVGDGVNDAASLALADVGVAMGAIGSDAAIEAADIALMRDNLLEIPEMIKLSRYTRKIVMQDFIIWGVVNCVGLALVLSRVIGPEGAAAFNFITDFFPLFNSMRLFNLHRQLK